MVPDTFEVLDTNVTEGTDAIVSLATEDPGAGTGRFVDRFGRVPW